MLICAYSGTIKNFVENTLVLAVHTGDKQPFLSGKIYKICKDDNSSLIIRKNNNKEIFRLCNGQITGDIRCEDVEIWLDTIKQAETDTIRPKVNKINSSSKTINGS
jgi:hypothetical protein